MKATYSHGMVIAHFHRSLAVFFYGVLVVAITTTLGVLVYLTFWQQGWRYIYYLDLGTLILWVIFVPMGFLFIAEIWKNPRAMWIENGELHIHEFALSGEAGPGLSADKNTIPLQAIAGVTSGRPDFPETADGLGIFIDLKSGVSRKVLSFLLREKDAAIRACIRQALATMQADV